MKHIKPKPEYMNPYNLAKARWFPFNSHNTIIKHIKKGLLPATQLSSGSFMIKIEDARAYAKLKHKLAKN